MRKKIFIQNKKMTEQNEQGNTLFPEKTKENLDEDDFFLTPMKKIKLKPSSSSTTPLTTANPKTKKSSATTLSVIENDDSSTVVNVSETTNINQTLNSDNNTASFQKRTKHSLAKRIIRYNAHRKTADEYLKKIHSDPFATLLILKKDTQHEIKRRAELIQELYQTHLKETSESSHVKENNINNDNDDKDEDITENVINDEDEKNDDKDKEESVEKTIKTDLVDAETFIFFITKLLKLDFGSSSALGAWQQSLLSFEKNLSPRKQQQNTQILNSPTHSLDKTNSNETKKMKNVGKIIENSLKEYDQRIALKHNIFFVETYNRIKLIIEKFSSIVDTIKNKNQANVNEDDMTLIVKIIELYLPDIYYLKSSLDKIKHHFTGNAESSVEFYEEQCLNSHVRTVNSCGVFENRFQQQNGLFASKKKKRQQQQQEEDKKSKPSDEKNTFSETKNIFQQKKTTDDRRDKIEIEEQFRKRFLVKKPYLSYTEKIKLTTVFNSKNNKRKRLIFQIMSNNNNTNNINPHNVSYGKVSCETNMQSLV